MDCVSGRSPPESSTLEMAMVGRRPPCTVSRNGITRLVYIYIAQSLPVDKRSSKRCPTSSECPLSFHNSLYRLLAVVEPSSLFEKLDRRSNDLQVWCPLIPRAVYELSPTVFLNPLSSQEKGYVSRSCFCYCTKFPSLFVPQRTRQDDVPNGLFTSLTLA
jgi:hypothetical protein